FNDLLKLEEINLSYNNISKINNPFSESQNLKDLNISNNNITTLELGMFKNLKSLNYLDLS
ncbi:PREDICTED: leucine-rich repeat and immunoglobulin-like domain-containing nogo receptor-interacting protein 1-B, partial [Nicrophorus vespilloides]|uniref:Leucine-rich repeat and immunoglobulin-like domain-containing nogo receptor-interacting protein 1-B n=1 Tax=Nicrophorus vespilloides TaxID=110193 RepID=A0ABM1MU90_NICVS